jgi:hypothetical protein
MRIKKDVLGSMLQPLSVARISCFIMIGYQINDELDMIRKEVVVAQSG